VRVGQNQDDVVRVVLDFKEVERHSVFYLQDPPRLVIDVVGEAAPQTAAAESPAPPARVEPTPLPSPAATPAPSPTPPVALARATPAPPPRAPEPDLLPTRRVAGVTPRLEPSPAAPRGTVEVDLRPAARPTPAPKLTPAATPPPPARTAAVRPTPAPPPPTPAPAAREPEPPQPVQPNRSGAISLARQLGLGARRIVVDAGHGGHDPGTIGRAGLQEKDLVLDVALRLTKLLREELGAEVVMTRATDVFIPLEERTAIANAKGADLFLSIHANSSRNARARGIETYFLSFAKNAHAEGVAARENAISAATLKDLQGLVKAIALNSKIDESHDFAATVQEALVRDLRRHYGADIVDRGVHTAPFYVLIGANMPSILAEIAFVSHPEEERRLKTPDYRERIARSLLEGVRAYLNALNRTPLRQLTRDRRAPTVVGRGGRR
jgi:N-acetylmuramoyl-L-alanine amidase